MSHRMCGGSRGGDLCVEDLEQRRWQRAVRYAFEFHDGGGAVAARVGGHGFVAHKHRLHVVGVDARLPEADVVACRTRCVSFVGIERLGWR